MVARLGLNFRRGEDQGTQDRSRQCWTWKLISPLDSEPGDLRDRGHQLPGSGIQGTGTQRRSQEPGKRSQELGLTLAAGGLV